MVEYYFHICLTAKFGDERHILVDSELCQKETMYSINEKVEHQD